MSPFGVEHLPRLLADDDHAGAALHHRLDRARAEVDRGEPLPRRDEQLVARFRVGVLVEVEARAAGLAREPDDAVAARLDPFARRLRGGARRRFASSAFVPVVCAHDVPAPSVRVAATTTATEEHASHVSILLVSRTR